MVRAPLEPGAPADLIGAEDSPLAGFETLAELSLVVRAGQVV